MNNQIISEKGFRLRAPFWPHAVIFFGFFEFFITTYIMTICWKFYTIAANILPTMFVIFQNTVKSKQLAGGSDFTWTIEMENELLSYQNSLIYVYVVSVFVILLTMVYVSSQFVSVEYNNDPDKTYPYCMDHKNISIVCAVFLIIFILINFLLITNLWVSCAKPYALFQEKYNNAIHEESLWDSIVEKYNCINDEDKEVHKSERCDTIVSKTVMPQIWLDIMFYSYGILHLIALIIFGFINQNCNTMDKIIDEEEINDVKTILLDKDFNHIHKC
uniref:Neuronal membrane glycoprotein M6-b n=1 Tax=Strongyloides stercoralis TaxID=6248 RepID=A0A0K0EMR0_STRER